MTDQEIKKRIEAFAPFAELMPSVVMVQQLDPFKTIYMSSRGLRELGISEPELLDMGTEYLANFFNLEDTEDYLRKLMGLLEKGNSEETFSFFQQVKLKERDEWVWHIASTRIFAEDYKGNATHMVTIAVPIHEMKHMTNKAERLLEEKNFFNINKEKFDSLGTREREILKLVALGKSSAEIADELYISILTVKTHRKTIKRKLDISSGYEFTVYAHAFDLI